MSEKERKTLYHYTDKKGADGIKKTGRINQSMDGRRDAANGPGVYLASIAPGQLSKTSTARKLYDGGNLPKQRVEEGRLDHGCKMHVNVSQVEKVRPHVYLHRNQDLGVKDPSKLDPKKTEMFQNQ